MQKCLQSVNVRSFAPTEPILCRRAFTHPHVHAASKILTAHYWMQMMIGLQVGHNRPCSWPGTGELWNKRSVKSTDSSCSQHFNVLNIRFHFSVLYIKTRLCSGAGWLTNNSTGNSSQQTASTTDFVHHLQTKLTAGRRAVFGVEWAQNVSPFQDHKSSFGLDKARQSVGSRLDLGPAVCFSLFYFTFIQVRAMENHAHHIKHLEAPCDLALYK